MQSAQREKVTAITHDLKRTARLMERALTPGERPLPTKLIYSLVGKLTAAQQAVRQVRTLLRLPLRVLRRMLAKGRGPRSAVPTHATPSSSDTTTWKSTGFALRLLAMYLRQWNGRSLHESKVVLRSQSDASPTYCGAVAVWVDRETSTNSASPAAAAAARDTWRLRPPDEAQRKQVSDDLELYDALTGDQQRQIQRLAQPADATLRISTEAPPHGVATELSWPIPPTLATAHITRKETLAAVTSN